MKIYNRLLLAVMIFIAAIFIGINLYINTLESSDNRSYRVEIERAALEIEKCGTERIDLKKYPSIKRIIRLDSADEVSFFEGQNEDYLIRYITGEYYRFDYDSNEEEFRHTVRLAANMSLGALSLVFVLLLVFIKRHIIKPFYYFGEIPYELSKGNLTVPIKENRNRFFGRFLWGMDLLRENLEKQKVMELELQKEKKTLILAISHDIKTPLSAIKLYAKALSKNLYGKREKQIEIAENINQKADEIETFVAQIIKASNEDFLDIEVELGEFYFSEMMQKIIDYYTEKLELLKIDFHIDNCQDCLLKGNADRGIEVLQNLLENALKYGDGHTISLEFSEEENCRLITVVNSGCTLSPTELPHIFDSFWRGSNVGSNGGSGLGLYICRQLMNKMGGEIFAHCEDGNMKVTAVFVRV